MKHKTNLSY